jgi:hypothetical protein
MHFSGSAITCEIKRHMTDRSYTQRQKHVEYYGHRRSNKHIKLKMIITEKHQTKKAYLLHDHAIYLRESTLYLLFK